MQPIIYFIYTYVRTEIEASFLRFFTWYLPIYLISNKNALAKMNFQKEFGRDEITYS